MDPADVRPLHLRYIVASLSAYRNVWWSMANEFDHLKTKTMSDWDRYFQIVQKSDPYDHLRSVHNGYVLYDYTKPWVSPPPAPSRTPPPPANPTNPNSKREQMAQSRRSSTDELNYEGTETPQMGPTQARKNAPPHLARRRQRHLRRTRRMLNRPPRHLALSTRRRTPRRILEKTPLPPPNLRLHPRQRASGPLPAIEMTPTPNARRHPRKNSNLLYLPTTQIPHGLALPTRLHRPRRRQQNSTSTSSTPGTPTITPVDDIFTSQNKRRQNRHRPRRQNHKTPRQTLPRPPHHPHHPLIETTRTPPGKGEGSPRSIRAGPLLGTIPPPPEPRLERRGLPRPIEQGPLLGAIPRMPVYHFTFHAYYVPGTPTTPKAGSSTATPNANAPPPTSPNIATNCQNTPPVLFPPPSKNPSLITSTTSAPCCSWHPFAISADATHSSTSSSPGTTELPDGKNPRHPQTSDRLPPTRPGRPCTKGKPWFSHGRRRTTPIHNKTYLHHLLYEYLPKHHGHFWRRELA